MIGNLKIENEMIGSVPRPLNLIKTINEFRDKKIDKSVLEKECSCVIKQTIDQLTKSKQNVITDGEQSKISFIGYPIYGSNQFESDGHVYMDKETSADPNKFGVCIPFKDGHTRHIPVLSGKNLPFKYARYASEYVEHLKSLNVNKLEDGSLPLIKQAVISPSALMLLYPGTAIPNYPRDEFIKDLLNESEKDIRQCFSAGASIVQIDATELRLSLKLDPSGGLFNSMIQLIESLLSRFNADELKKIGIHECRGGDQLSPHSETVVISEALIPTLLKSLSCSRFYIEFGGESKDEQLKILSAVVSNIRPNQKVFFGVTKTDHQVETVEEILNLSKLIASKIPHQQFGLCDSCGFSPFYDDENLPREVAFNKMLNRSIAAKLLEDELNK